jgi:uncharacterized coiled-coil protein SlyX
MTSRESRDALVAEITVAVDAALAPRLAAAMAPVVDAVLSLQANQAALVAAVNGLADRVGSLEKTTSRLAEVVGGMQQVQQTLVASVERLHTERLVHIESRLAALETRTTANDRR